MAEYLACNSEEAKKILKKHSKRIILQLINDGQEELAVAFLKTGLVSTQTMKSLLQIVEGKEMVVVKSYVLKKMRENRGKGDNKRFSI